VEIQATLATLEPVEVAESPDFEDVRESLAKLAPRDRLETLGYLELLERAAVLEQLVHRAPVGDLDQRG